MYDTKLFSKYRYSGVYFPIFNRLAYLHSKDKIKFGNYQKNIFKNSWLKIWVVTKTVLYLHSK